jgi:glycosyl transferase, family 25
MKVEDIGVWLINLPNDVGRRSAMEHQLTKLGLFWQLFPAIDGGARRDELVKGADEAAYQRNMGMSLLPGKLGVYASHLAVWEAFIASDHDVAMILEDDVVFHDDFLEALAIALAGREHWDLVRFNAIRAKLPVIQGTLGKYRLNAYVGPFTGNACYLIKKNVARKLVSKLYPQTRALDHELNRFFVHDYRQRGLEPFASHTDDQNVSTITGVGFAKVRKFMWYRRLPHYRLKAFNYLCRFFYLVRTGAFPGRREPLSLRDE